MKINRPAYIWCCRTRRLCLYSTSFSCRHQSFLHFADINTKEPWKGTKRENLGVLGSQCGCLRQYDCRYTYIGVLIDCYCRQKEVDGRSCSGAPLCNDAPGRFRFWISRRGLSLLSEHSWQERIKTFALRVNSLFPCWAWRKRRMRLVTLSKVNLSATESPKKKKNKNPGKNGSFQLRFELHTAHLRFARCSCTGFRYGNETRKQVVKPTPTRKKMWFIKA